MKIFKEDDGLLDRVSKSITIAGVCFGAWAYFHTIHPVFEKEIELQNLRGESQTLSVQVQKLSSTLAVLQQDKISLESNIASLHSQQSKLKDNIVQKENELKIVVASFKDASDSATLNKLQYYSEKITSAYTLAVVSGRGSSFDVLGFSQELLATHIPGQDDKYGTQAYEYFKKYVNEHEGKIISGDRVIEFAVSLFFKYKIELIEQRISSHK
ncbi:kinetochore Spc7 family protein [Pseudomonas profundi]|uniref:hypothetical protein n=1 Tax=Pseudomonas profundi TaxID=1981513 RepID=UPI00123A3B0B|nr:hypothetical protein [Pseudomonas profundi]